MNKLAKWGNTFGSLKVLFKMFPETPIMEGELEVLTTNNFPVVIRHNEKYFNPEIMVPYSKELESILFDLPERKQWIILKSIILANKIIEEEL